MPCVSLSYTMNLKCKVHFAVTKNVQAYAGSVIFIVLLSPCLFSSAQHKQSFGMKEWLILSQLPSTLVLLSPVDYLKTDFANRLNVEMQWDTGARSCFSLLDSACLMLSRGAKVFDLLVMSCRVQTLGSVSTRPVHVHFAPSLLWKVI